ncbi:MAG: serine hydrolase [Thermoguttaceae bacterium]|nr:serine hydrolase [Thermoguttaceae bacterium]
MALSRLSTFVLALASLCGAVFGQNLDENGALPRATPESVGVSSQAVAETLQRLDSEFNRVDGVMILRDGKVISEAWRAPNAPDKPHALYSLSKSFCSTAIGFAVDEGKLALDQKLVDFFPEDVPENHDPKLEKVTLAHLLSMSCGHKSEPALNGLIGTDYLLEPFLPDEKPTWVQTFLAHPIEFEPGEHFCYNTAGTYMCSAILQKATGETVRDFLMPRLFEPLHIDKPYWEVSPQGVNKGGTGLFLKTEDIAKLGQLYLQKGMWNGKRLLSEEWVENATSKHVSNGDNPDSDWAQGYGFQFWRCRYNVYRGDGMYSQFCVVMPEQNAVVAINSDCNNYQGELNVLFETLMPAMKSADPLPENPDALAKLREVEKSLGPKEGQSGSGVFEMSLYSDALKREKKYRVYVPNEYRTTSTYYPVLYLLHGLGGDETNWSHPERGNMQAICDEWFAKHPDKKRIIVMPAGEDKIWYRDSADDTCKYETFFFKELIPHVEARFRIKRSDQDGPYVDPNAPETVGREYRAIAGLSMGGYGSLLYALRHPNYFSACYAMSAAIRTQDELKDVPLKEFQKRYFSRADFGEDENRFDDYFFANDPHTLVGKLSDDNKKALRFFLDCGDDDSLLLGNYAFFREARAAKASCELRVRDGGHTWQYWREALPMALEFISK